VRYRSAASLIVGLVALIAAIAATAGGIAGSGQRPPPGSSNTSPPPSTARSGPAPELCNVTSRVGTLTVTRTDGFPRNGFTFSFPSMITVHSAVAARKVARALCALPTVPQGAVFHCPADFGIVYHLAFKLETGGSVQPVTVDATGCQFVKGAGQGKRRAATAHSFWATLGRAMGLAHPTNTTFRGSAGRSS
jgi:hypothetical protein